MAIDNVRPANLARQDNTVLSGAVENLGQLVASIGEIAGTALMFDAGLYFAGYTQSEHFYGTWVQTSHFLKFCDHSPYCYAVWNPIREYGFNPMNAGQVETQFYAGLCISIAAPVIGSGCSLVARVIRKLNAAF